MTRFMRSGIRAVVLILALTLAAQTAAQEITGTITGLVKDQSGGIVPGATVTVRNVDTNVSKTLTTDDTGVYVFPLLPPWQL
jgi:hypothetical protein